MVGVVVVFIAVFVGDFFFQMAWPLTSGGDKDELLTASLAVDPSISFDSHISRLVVIVYAVHNNEENGEDLKRV